MVTFRFHAVLLPIKHQSYLFFFYKHPNMLIGTLFLGFLILNKLFVLFFAVQLVITPAAPILLYFNLEKHHL